MRSMGSIAKLAIFMLACLTACGQMHKHWLIAPKPSSGGGLPIPTAGLVYWMDAEWGRTNVTGGATNNVNVSPPSDGDTLSGFLSRTPLSATPWCFANTIFNTTGGTSNRARLTYSNNTMYLEDEPSHIGRSQPISFYAVVYFDYLYTCMFDGSPDGSHSTRVDGTFDLTSGELHMTCGTALSGGATTIPNNTWMLISVGMAGANSFIRTNGVDYLRGDAGTNGTSAWIIGNQIGLAKSLRGRLSEFILYNETNVIDAVEAYLKQKHGLP